MFDDWTASLAEAVTWSRAGATFLWSSLLRPGTIDAGAPGPWEDAVREVVNRRRALLAARGIPPKRGCDFGYGGRLIAYAPLMTLSDGAAEVSSEGFFDVHNVPPWGTWVGAVRPEDGSLPAARRVDVSVVLLAVVPSQALSQAAAGIDVIPEMCVWWPAPNLLPPSLRSIEFAWS